ncbi:hypothetical protein BHU72_04360 [Desulfuribacillus stibiiarsenatis]|uniref:Isoprenylcysteine carboxyl methyltransferase n=1 Tax=Desulfuribacillus stibiiarsenatis TaxID=1390249 RepID=A0A1E5L5J4_9FIRM|nr:isoprenylcysteine carboxylmethyltransferase family protein [Desulfuribacillus stibiiarsenatis]OEH85334.1 hypothetical protein BHU72_04360 [Desulfuribacillus stibiiarsenatis]
MLFFLCLFLFVVLQRLAELQLAKRNERWMLSQGAEESGQSHYPYIVALHVLFLASYFVEVMSTGAQRITGWWIPFSAFMLAQALRVWTLRSLGKYWNTKILVLPSATLVSRGPYKYIRHPNYLIVALEILALPMIFGAFYTAAIFTISNAALLLFIRIPEEEKALKKVREKNHEIG